MKYENFYFNISKILSSRIYVHVYIQVYVRLLLQVVMSEKKLKLVLKNNKFQRTAHVFVFFIPEFLIRTL